MSPRDEATPAPSSRRRLLLAGVAVLLCAALAVLAVVAGRGGGDGDTAAAATTAAPGTTATAYPTEVVLPTGTVPPAPPTPEPTGPTEDATALPPSLPPVVVGEQAAVGDGVTAEVQDLEAVEGSAEGPGQVAGPAVRVTVRITNGTDAPVSLDAVAVDLTTGPDATPASPLEDASYAPFTGTVEPGGDAVGVYVFTVPGDARDAVTVAVGYQAGAPYLVFTGTAD
ncbi:hypothetical protein ACI798_19785 [Geodermatophilus sp. SYSU D01045]